MESERKVRGRRGSKEMKRGDGREKFNVKGKKRKWMVEMMAKGEGGEGKIVFELL